MEIMVPYVVRQGDYLDRIALRSGCDPGDIWDHPKNAELRKRRPDGRILCPGDLLWVPRQRTKQYELSQGERNEFVLEIPVAEVHLRLFDDDGPWAHEPYLVEGENPPVPRQADDQGIVHHQVRVTDNSLVLYFPKRDLRHVFQIGHLDPIEEPSGLRQRLEQLGYLARGGTGSEGISAALRRFQDDQDLPATGVLDSATRDLLDSVYQGK